MNNSNPDPVDEANRGQTVKVKHPAATREVLDTIELGTRVADALNGGQK